MLPSLALEPPKGDQWIHEIKFDGYRTELVIEDGEAQAFTRNRLDWSDRYRPIVDAAGKLRCRSAVIDGEVVAMDATGRSDFDAMRTAVALGGRSLVFVAFDLMFLNDKDHRTLPLEERRAELRRLIPRSAKSRLQFSEAIAASGPDVFASAERLGLEGIVSKRLGSHYRSGRVDTWRKVKCCTESALVLIGTELDKRSGAPVALLARKGEEELSYAGGAFFALKDAPRSALRDRLARLIVDRSPIPALRKRDARWVKPEPVVGVRHLRGAGRECPPPFPTRSVDQV
jgi:DNA ligase D-like protein (predicted ligase)